MNQPAHPPRSTTRHRRYTGPELGALLAKVREELGAEASIVEANRVRTGGVAGFFARESYELVAAGTETQHEPAARTQPVAAPPVPARTPARQPPVNRSMGVSMALLERAEAVSAHERTVLRERAAADPYDLRDRPTSTRFGEVLEARLGDPSPADPDLAPRTIDIIERDRSSVPIETEPAVTIDPEPAIPVRDPQPAPATAEPQPQPQPHDADPQPHDAEPQPQPHDAEPEPHTAAPELQPQPAHPSREPAPQPVAQPAPSAGSAGPVEAIVTVVGELATALDLTEHGLADDGEGRTELVVLTPSDPAASPLAARPAGTVGTYYEQVSGRLFTWIGHRRRGIAVIDAALGDRVVGEVRCLAALGSGTVHLAARSETEAARLLRLLHGYDGRVVVDLIEPDG